MAKYKPTASTKKVETKYKSDFGSHADMINEEYVEFNSGDHGYVVCTDGRGDYVTIRKNIDNGLCDFNRSMNIELRDATLKEKLETLNDLKTPEGQ